MFTNFDVSVICVSNNLIQAQNELIDSLKKQDIKYELVLLDNTDGKFNSAAHALNYGASISQGEILVFSHQDIILKSQHELRKLCEDIESVDVGDIVGTQGVREKEKKLYTNLTGGNPITLSMVDDFPETIIEVACVDEGLFGMKRETWECHRFDEEICDNWHLYCVEACLNSRKKGHKIYVSPIQVHHSSMGRISISYMNNMRSLCSKYRDSFKYIWTTCYKVRTNRFYINMLRLIWILNRVVRRKKLQ